LLVVVLEELRSRVVEGNSLEAVLAVGRLHLVELHIVVVEERRSPGYRRVVVVVVRIASSVEDREVLSSHLVEGMRLEAVDNLGWTAWVAVESIGCFEEDIADVVVLIRW